ncbi:hypothetical protein VKT23_016834 [Stygiomarasmius scandens]|uniref:Uncharacterized protein n=1 Tax=Marasmiellus scandens TaxID=2682957 RepID=A0ABR1IWW9_9AGAR
MSTSLPQGPVRPLEYTHIYADVPQDIPPSESVPDPINEEDPPAEEYSLSAMNINPNVLNSALLYELHYKTVLTLELIADLWEVTTWSKCWIEHYVWFELLVPRHSCFEDELITATVQAKIRGKAHLCGLGLYASGHPMVTPKVNEAIALALSISRKELYMSVYQCTYTTFGGMVNELVSEKLSCIPNFQVKLTNAEWNLLLGNVCWFRAAAPLNPPDLSGPTRQQTDNFFDTVKVKLIQALPIMDQDDLWRSHVWRMMEEDWECYTAQFEEITFENYIDLTSVDV